MPDFRAPLGLRAFAQRVVVVLALAGLAALIGALATRGAHLLLVAFGGLLFGIFLHGLASTLSKHTPIPYAAALGIVGLLYFAALLGAGYLIGPHVAAQFDQFGLRVPQGWGEVEQWLRQYEWGRALVGVLPSPGDDPGGALGVGVATRVMGVVSALIKGSTDALLIFVLGIYVAATPRLYAGGVVRLVPKHGRERAWEVLHAVRFALARWLIGRVLSMAVVGVLTWGGLVLLGVPLALSLALSAALLSFVPNLGPLLSLVPAALVGLSESTELALYVVLLYGLVQLIESNLITPIIQHRAVSMPPALLLTNQVLMGTIFGAIGLLFATPITVVVMLLVQLLYVRQALDDDMDLMGHAERVVDEDESRDEPRS